jgi:DNA-directed RNA polymerase specialized sigma24 family protein
MRNCEISVSTIESLRRVAHRYAYASDEVDDLVQDVLLAALAQKRDFRGPNFLPWACGTVKRHAMFLARTAGRRKRREALYGSQPFPSTGGERRLPQDFITALPPSLRTVAILVNAGLGRAEIAHLLALPDTALRQRISGLRRAWVRSGADVEFLEDELAPRGREPCGLLRRSLKANLTKLRYRRFAVADPDGHRIFFSGAHDSPGRGNMSAPNH